MRIIYFREKTNACLYTGFLTLKFKKIIWFHIKPAILSQKLTLETFPLFDSIRSRNVRSFMIRSRGADPNNCQMKSLESFLNNFKFDASFDSIARNLSATRNCPFMKWTNFISMLASPLKIILGFHNKILSYKCYIF